MVQKGLTHKKKFKPKKESPLKQPGEDYGIIDKIWGGNRFNVILCSIGKTYNASARGAIANMKISIGDIVLCQKDESTTEIKYYIIWRYTKEESDNLKKIGELNIKSTSEKSNVMFEQDVNDIKDNNNIIVIDDI
jgi:initiation factor 1A